MRSSLAKVLHPVAGRPLIDYSLALCRELGVEQPVVVLNPHQAEVAAHVEGRCEVVWQREQRGTGHALQQVPAERLGGKRVITLYGDMPLISAEWVREVIAAQEGAAAALIAIDHGPPSYGRIIRNADGTLDTIVEAKDLTPDQQSIHETNMGVYCFDGDRLVEALPRLSDDNVAREFYLTEIFRWLRPVRVIKKEAHHGETIGVNTRRELADAERWMQRALQGRLMDAGVTFVAPDTCFVEAGVEIGQDSVIEPFTILRGATSIGAGCRIGPHVDVADSAIGDNCAVQHSWLRGCTVGAGSDCGPFSKLRPGTEVGERVHVGSFAELVRTRVGPESAVPHFAYLGDAVIGARVNIAAGTITANYDGEKKNPTVIEDDVFVGVDTMLRAPVRLGRGSRTGAGSVVTKDVPPGATAVGVPARVIKRSQSEGGSSK